MRLNEHWLWLGPRVALSEAGVTVFRAFPGAWWIADGDEMLGAFDDRSILRAVRVACTPTIDGCEKGPHKFGIAELSSRRPLRRGPKWQIVAEADLPDSVTEYDRSALEPVRGCCTVSEAVPKIAESPISAWDQYIAQCPTSGGKLAATWNAHPKGSPVFLRGHSLDTGFVVVDLPPSETALP